MRKTAKTRKPRWLSKARAILGWAAVGACTAAGSAGCSTTTAMTAPSQEKMGDPLLGPAPAAPPASPPASAQAWLPPIPQNNGVATNASLAAHTQPPQTLAISGNGDGWLRKIDAASTNSTLRAPITPVSQPRVEPVPKDNTFTDTASPGSPAPAIQPAGSWAASIPTTPNAAPDELKQLLESRGVIGSKEETVAGGIHLRCVVANPATPNSNQVYETTAIDYPTAVRAIIQQIDQHRP